MALKKFIMNNNQALRYRFPKIKNEKHQFIQKPVADMIHSLGSMKEMINVSIRFLKSKMREYDLIWSHIRELYNDMEGRGIEIPSGSKSEVESII